MQAESSRTRLDSRLFVNQHISVLYVLKRSGNVCDDLYYKMLVC